MSASLVSGVMNFRDVGGLPASGGVTRSGVLFRSGNLAHLDDVGKTDIAALQVERIIDLRSDEEVERDPSRAEGIPTVRVPLFLGSVSSFFVKQMNLADMYRSLVDDSADRVIAAVRELIHTQPVLVHCTVGKDRTGVTVALALAAAGVDEEAIIADYARTETLLPEQRNTEVVAKLSALYPDFPLIEELATRSPAQVMRELLRALTEQYGSPTDYLLAHGLTQTEVEQLRQILVVKQA